MSEKRLRTRCFVLGFALTFLVLALAALLVVYRYSPKLPGQTEPDDTSSALDSSYLPTGNDRLSFLCIGVDDGNNRAVYFTLFELNAVTGKAPVVSFPVSMKLPGSGETLSGLYAKGGAELVKSSLSQALGIPVDRYLVTTRESFMELVSAVGSIQYNLPTDIDYRTEAFTVHMQQGHQLLDAAKMYAVMTYDRYEGGERARLAMSSDVIASLINQHLDLFASDQVEKVFNTIVNEVRTDLNRNDLLLHQKAFLFLSQLANRPSFPVEVVDTNNFNEGDYTPSEATLARLRNAFGTAQGGTVGTEEPQQ